jgi:hypothetical protein
MRGGLKWAGVIGLFTASGVSAQSLVPTAIGIAMGMQHRAPMTGRWVHDADGDYAVWDAASTAAAGSEVSSVGKSVVVDQAPLVPQSLFETDQDLVADGKLWLPGGGLLVKMVGGEDGGNWFCTWRYDQVASATSAQFPKGEREFCLQTDGAGHTIANHLENSFFPALLTVLPSAREMRIKNLNSVNLRETSRDALPPRVALAISAEWHSRNGGTVCLRGHMDAVEAIQEQCFGSVGQTIEYAGGRYTLTAMGQQNRFKIRIDRALSMRGLTPEHR